MAVQEKTNSISNNNDKIASPSEKIKNAQEFIIQIEAYLALNPGWHNKGWMHRAAAYIKVDNYNPANALKFYTAGVEASANKKYAEALQHYEKAVSLDAKFPWPANNLAWILATCPEDSQRDGKRAIEFSRRANSIQKAEVPDFINTLAASYATQGNFDTAISLCQKSIEMWPTEQYKDMLNCFQRRSVYIHRERTTENTNLISPEGFGKIKWGMCKLDAIEFFKDWDMKSNDLVVVGFESNKGYNAIFNFHFYHDRLWRVQVIAKNISEDALLKDFLNESFTGAKEFTTAKMTPKDKRPEVILESGETRINLQFVFWEKEAMIDFISKKYQNYVQQKS